MAASLVLATAVAPISASADPGACAIARKVPLDQTLGTCVGTFAPGRVEYRVATNIDTVGSWTVSWRRTSDNHLLAQDTCHVSAPLTMFDGFAECTGGAADGSWATGSGASLAGLGVTFLDTSYRNTLIPVKVSLTVGPYKDGTPFSGSLQFAVRQS